MEFYQIQRKSKCMIPVKLNTMEIKDKDLEVWEEESIQIKYLRCSLVAVVWAEWEEWEEWVEWVEWVEEAEEVEEIQNSLSVSVDFIEY